MWARHVKRKSTTIASYEPVFQRQRLIALSLLASRSLFSNLYTCTVDVQKKFPIPTYVQWVRVQKERHVNGMDQPFRRLLVINCEKWNDIQAIYSV